MARQGGDRWRLKQETAPMETSSWFDVAEAPRTVVYCLCLGHMAGYGVVVRDRNVETRCG
jgi:hypothetical protein